MDHEGNKQVIIMTKNVISGAQAVAEAVRMCKPDVIAAYPITPQIIGIASNERIHT